METWTIRVAYFIVFSFLVSERFGSCARLNDEGMRRRRESVQDNNPTGSLSNWGEGKLMDFLFRVEDSRFSGKILTALQEHDTISGDVTDDGWFGSCRKCLTKTLWSDTARQHRKARELKSSEPSKNLPPVQPSLAQQLPPKSPEPESKKHSSVPHWAIYAFSIGGALCLALVATAMYLLFSRRNKDKTVMPWAIGLSGQLSKAFVTGVPSLERTELEAACEGFINVIGTLSECILYKGTLSSGVEIAVLSTSVNCGEEWLDRSEEKFKNKITVLSKVNHKNFMNLLGYCSCDEPFTRMMVFEYAPCGSLFEHLHIREEEHLDWPTRLRIIMGVAYCLEHMNQLDPPVNPRSLSSSSIYLTEDYAAKIADIEFSKEDAASQDSNRTSKDQESIVYKFGILLLEVISGRRPFSEDHGLLVLWASSYLDGKRPLGAMADPTLMKSSAVSEKDVAALCEVVRVCIRKETETEKRASMGEVARMVRGVTALSPEEVTPRKNPLWWAELQIASSETA